MKQQLRDRLNELGLSGLFDALFAPGSPLALLSAQAIYVAEPVLSAFADAASVTALAQELESWDDPASGAEADVTSHQGVE